jgi:hypothetical protein
MGGDAEVFAAVHVLSVASVASGAYGVAWTTRAQAGIWLCSACRLPPSPSGDCAPGCLSLVIRLAVVAGVTVRRAPTRDKRQRCGRL